MNQAEIDLRKQLVLNAPGGDLNYSVVAGAGAGKSTMLSKRISQQIKNGEALESFVIITYTNVAANELRDKIAQELTEMLLDTTLSGIEKENITSALEKIELIQVSTIHSFLLQILREYAFESNLSLDAYKLEDDEDEERKEAFFKKWFETHYKEINKFRGDWDIKQQSDGKIINRLNAIMKNMFFDMSSLREDIVVDTKDHSAQLEQMAKDYVEKYLTIFIAFCTEVRAKWPNTKKGTPVLGVDDVHTMLNNVDAVQNNIKLGQPSFNDALLLSDAIEAFNKRVADIKRGKTFYGRGADDSGLVGLYPTLPSDEFEWNFGMKYEKFWLYSDKAAKLADYVIGMRDAYQKEIDSQAIELSDDDILYRAEKLLNSHPEILKKLRTQYTKIYVDEFQDTTACQARIVRLLAGKDGSGLSPFDPKENNIVLVGDPKQSIYRFTGAEKAVYDEVNGQIDTLPNTIAQKVNLDANFRSNTDIVNWVNDKFNTLIHSYNAMNSDWNVQEKNALHGVYTYEFTDPDGTGKYNENADFESVVNIIKELVSSDKYFIEEFNRKENTYSLRRIKYSDFMVITRTGTCLGEFLSCFNRAGIPVNLNGKVKFEDDIIAKNFIGILSYFANHKNAHKAYAAAQIVSGINGAKDDDAYIEDAKNQLSDLRHQFIKEKLDTPSIVKRILENEKLYLPQKSYSVEEVKEYKSHLYQMIEACLSKNDGDLRQFAELMKKYVEKDLKKSIPLQSDEDAVSLLNVHKAKGLTGNIVIIANRKNSTEARYDGFKSLGKYYPAASYKPGQKSLPVIFPSFGFDEALLKQARDEELAENTRLEYVAATRAAHALIIMPQFGNEKHPWFSSEIFDINNLPDIGAWIEDRKKDTGTYPISVLSKTGAAFENLANLRENLDKADMAKISSSVVDNINPSRLEPVGLTGYKPEDAGYVEEDDRPKGNIFGNVMHRTYELIVSRFLDIKDFDEAGREAHIKRIINQAISEQYEELHIEDNPDEFLAYLTQKMKEYYSKIILPIMESACEVYPEYSFSFYVPKEDVVDFKAKFNPYLRRLSPSREIQTDNIWINGTTDLVVKMQDGKIKVYDYKSDKRHGKPVADFEKSLMSKYEGQLSLYQYAIGKAFGVKDVDVEIIHLYK